MTLESFHLKIKDIFSTYFLINFSRPSLKKKHASPFLLFYDLRMLRCRIKHEMKQIHIIIHRPGNNLLSS